MERTKLLYLFDKLDVGGSEELLLTTLKYIDKNKFSIYICCMQKKGNLSDEIENLGFKICALNMKSKIYNLRIFFRLKVIVDNIKPEIIHSHSFYPNFYGRIVGKCSKTPVIIATEHGTISYKKKIIHKCIDHLLAYITDCFLIVSESVKQFALKEYAIPQKKIHVLNNSIDLNKFSVSESKTDLRIKFGFDKDTIILGNVANIVPWKGHIYLIRALSMMLNLVINIQLIIIGDDPLGHKRVLEQETERLKVKDKVRFLGLRRDIPQLLKAMDIFVFPSLTEGFGIAVLEAMAMGLPVVASRVEGLNEVIINGESGTLVPPADPKAMAEAIVDLLQDNIKAQQFCQKAKERVISKFSPQKYIADLENLYVSLLKEKGLGSDLC